MRKTTFILTLLVLALSFVFAYGNVDATPRRDVITASPTKRLKPPIPTSTPTPVWVT
jgi:hypothetical protein